MTLRKEKMELEKFQIKVFYIIEISQGFQI